MCLEHPVMSTTAMITTLTGTIARIMVSPRRRRNDSLRLQILPVPIEIPLHPVAPVARLVQLVMLAGVDDELGVASEALERLVHLLGVEERDVEVGVAAEEE